MSLSDKVKTNINPQCICRNKLNKFGCNVSLKDVSDPKLVVDFDKPGAPLGENDKRCDYLVVADSKDGSWVSVLELKKGKLDASQVVEQLRAGTRATENLIPSNEAEAEAVRFRPVVFCRGGSKHEMKKLKVRSNSIAFHKQREVVRVMSCGGKLSNVLR